MVESYLTSSEQKSNLASLDKWDELLKAFIHLKLHSGKCLVFISSSFWHTCTPLVQFESWLSVAWGMNNLFFKVANTLSIIHRNPPHIIHPLVHICVKLLLEGVWLIYIVSLHKDIEFIELSIVNFLFNWTHF